MPCHSHCKWLLGKARQKGGKGSVRRREACEGVPCAKWQARLKLDRPDLTGHRRSPTVSDGIRRYPTGSERPGPSTRASRAMPKPTVGKRKATTGAANRGKKKGQGALRPGTRVSPCLLLSFVQFLHLPFLFLCVCLSFSGSALKHSNASSKPGRTTPKGETRVRKAGSHMRSESSSANPLATRIRADSSGFERIRADSSAAFRVRHH